VGPLVRGLAPPGYPPTSLPGLSLIRGSLAQTPFASIRVHSRLEIFRSERFNREWTRMHANGCVEYNIGVGPRQVVGLVKVASF
jgi:hypothetical protein